jgi:dsRNA-specific ribonuclease
MHAIHCTVHCRCAPTIAHSIDKFSEDVYAYVTDEAPPPKALADTFEALMAAVYIDCNFDMSVICKLFWPLLEVSTTLCTVTACILQ